MTELIQGEEIMLGGERFVLPPYNLKFIADIRPGYIKKLEKVQNWGPAEMRQGVEMVHYALVRNYPDLTIDRLMELLDVPTLLGLQDAIARVNGFQAGELAPGEIAPIGE